MIKIKPYTERVNRDEIFRLYLNMAAYVMPFYLEDIFPDGLFYPDGNQSRSICCFNRHPRKRTEKYKQILKTYHIADGPTISDRRKADALLAEEIIRKYSEVLHRFLYDGSSGDGHVVPENLRILLTTPSDEKGIEQSGLKQVFEHAMDVSKEAKADLSEYVFRYEAFANQEGINCFVSLLGIDVCPYCNRLYTTAVARSPSAFSVRPALDHYRSKSFYPFLALSILNLVPCCSVCNHIKGNRKEALIYPYMEEMGTEYVFRTQPKEGISYLTGSCVSIKDFSIIFTEKQTVDPAKREHITNSISILQLEALYNSHRDYASSLMLQRYVFTAEMISELKKQFPDLFHDESEIRNMLYLMDVSHENWAKHPLSKLTHDIAEELDELYGDSR